MSWSDAFRVIALPIAGAIVLVFVMVVTISLLLSAPAKPAYPPAEQALGAKPHPPRSNAISKTDRLVEHPVPEVSEEDLARFRRGMIVMRGETFVPAAEPVRVLQPKPRADDVCARHHMVKVWYGKRWRCRH